MIKVKVTESEHRDMSFVLGMIHNLVLEIQLYRVDLLLRVHPSETHPDHNSDLKPPQAY